MLQAFSYIVYLLGAYFFYHTVQKQLQITVFRKANKNLAHIGQNPIKNIVVGGWIALTHVSFDSFLSHLLVMTNTGYFKARDFISILAGGLFVAFSLNILMLYSDQFFNFLSYYYLLPIAIFYPIKRLRPWIKMVFLTSLFVFTLAFFSVNLPAQDSQYLLLLLPLLFPSLIFWPLVFTSLQLSIVYTFVALLVSIFSLLFYHIFLTIKGNTQQKRILVSAFILWSTLLPALYFVFNEALWMPYAYVFIVLFMSVAIYPLYKTLSELVVRDRKYKEANALKWIEPLGVYHSAYFAEILFLEIKKKAALVLTMLEQVRTSFTIKSHDLAVEKRLQKYEKITDNMQSEIIRFSECLMRYEMSAYSSKKIRSILKISSELESMADSCITLFKMLEHIEVLENSPEYQEKMKDYLDRTVSYFEQVFDELQSKDFFEKNTVFAKTSMQLGQDLAAIRRSLYKVIEQGQLESPLAAYAVEWNANIKKLKGHISNIYQAHQGIR